MAALVKWRKERQIGSNAAKLLPPDYTTIQKIACLPDETFRALLADGTINPTVKRNDIAKIPRQQFTDIVRNLPLEEAAAKERQLLAGEKFCLLALPDTRPEGSDPAPH
jgi:hypothetical protein